MKNQEELNQLKSKALTNDQLLNLRGGAEPGSGGCAPGESIWSCEILACFDCSPTYGLICAATSYAAEVKYWNAYPTTFSVGCEAPNAPQ